MEYVNRTVKRFVWFFLLWRQLHLYSLCYAAHYSLIKCKTMIIAIHSKPKIRWLFSFHLHISWCSPTFFSFAARNLLFYHSMETHKTELDEKTIQLDKKNRKNETGRRMNRNSCTVENNGLNDSYVNNNDK